MPGAKPHHEKIRPPEPAGDGRYVEGYTAGWSNARTSIVRMVLKLLRKHGYESSARLVEKELK